MAENNNTPIITPEQAVETEMLNEQVAPEAPLTPEQLAAIETPQSLEAQVQQADFNQFDTSHLQDEIAQDQINLAAEKSIKNNIYDKVQGTDFSKYSDEQWQQEQRDLAAQKAKDEEQIAVDAEIKKASIMDQLSSLKAQEEAEVDQHQKLMEEQQALFADMEDLKKQAKDTQVDDFWSSSSTGTKIMAALAIGLGAAAAVQRGDGQNQGLQMVMNIVNQQAKAKQQSFKNQLALKSAVLDKVQSQLRVLDSKTQSQVKKAQITNMMNQFKMEQQKNDLAMKQELEKSRMRNRLRTRQANLSEEQTMYDNLDKNQKEQANNLRKDYEKNIKESQVENIIPTAEDLKKFTKSPSAAGDIAIVFSYMKTLDPGSVVREGEFGLAAESGSIPQRTMAKINKILTGERLDPAVRKDFLKQATSMVKTRLKQAEKISNRFRDLAISQGIPPQVGLGVKDYSLAAILPEEAAYEFVKRNTKWTDKQIKDSMKANNEDIFGILQRLKR
jgi:hypothetical protein